MTKIDVFSGFLGAGKTTLIKKLIDEAYQGEKLVLIENEFGEIGIDGGFLQEAGVQVEEMNSGCICCSLTGDFRTALREVVERFTPDRILIEPSGVGKLSDVVAAVESVADLGLTVNALGVVVDAAKCRMYMKNFGEFFNNQVENAGCIVLSRTGGMAQAKIDQAVELLRGKNPSAVIITTPWEELDGQQILAALEKRDTLAAAMEAMEHEHHDHVCDCGCDHEHHHDHHEHHHHEHHEHHYDEHGVCECGHHHEEHEHHHHEHDHEHECHHHDHCHDGHHDHCGHEHEHEHHEHDCDCGHDHHEHHHHEHHEHHYDEHGVCECGHHHEEHEHHHEHHHDHDGNCGHDHGHHHHHHHHADEVFGSWGCETARKFTRHELEERLTALEREADYGMVLRAKGIVDSAEGAWFHFDYTPGEINIRTGAAGVTGRLCVIGAQLKEEAVAALFR